MFIFLTIIGISEIFVFFIALLYFQGNCENPKSLSELSLPESLSSKGTYHNGACTYDQLKGLNYFSKLTGCVEALHDELNSQTEFINNVRGLPWFFCFLVLTGLPNFSIKHLDSISAFCRVILVIGVIIVTIFILIIADVITDHLRSSHRYDELYDYALNIVSKYEELLDCNLHVLPKGFFITFEFIFKIKKELSEEQFNKLGRNISQELYYFCKKFGVENNFVVVLSRY